MVMPFSIGGSSSDTQSESSSYSESGGFDTSQSYLSPEQFAIQQRMFGSLQPMINRGPGAVSPGYGFNTGLSGDRMREMGNRAYNQGQSMYQRGNQNLQKLQGSGHAAQRGMQTGMYQGRTGMQQLGMFAQQNNPYLQQQTQGLAQDFGRMFSEQILPGIRSEFGGANQRGGSRQALAEGTAAGRTMEEFGQAANSMRMNAYGQMQNAAQARASIGTQAGLGYGQLRNQAFGQAAQMGYGAGSDLYGFAGQQAQNLGNLANVSARTAMMPFEIGASVLGAPSVLNQSLGMDYSMSESSSTSSSESDEFNFGLG